MISHLARLEAVDTGLAQPTATVRHRYLSERPLVLVPLTTAGEAGAPLGALVGTDRTAPRLLVVPQPRDRDLRFAFLAELADLVLPYVEAHAEQVEPAERTETDPETGKRVKVEVELCAQAPQLIVPSRAGVDLVRLLGRSMRFRRTAEQDPETPHPAPPRVPLLGRWLTHFGERARVPGSSLLLALTEVLGRHWATGQSSLEDQHLGALLAWIDPPEGSSGAEAALRAELLRDERGQLRCPPAGPATDPAFDNKLLAPAIERYDRARTALAAAEDGMAADDRLGDLTAAEREIRALVERVTRPTWDSVWQGLDLLRALPEGARVEERWTRDRWSFTGHRDRVVAGEPPQPRLDDAVTAANKLAAREREQARLEAQEALDDPLVMAGRRLSGEAFSGEVTEVVMAYAEGRRPSPRPLVTVRTDDRPYLSEGVKVYRSLGGKPQAAEFVGLEDAVHGDPHDDKGEDRGDSRDARGDGAVLVVLRIVDKMGRGKEPEAGSVPEKGDRLCFTLFEHEQRGGAKLPDPEQTPWTHGGPPGERTAPEPADQVTEEDVL
ncbi:membrane protein [Streptomyces sp. AS58]|nr:membrane protein [Streptomyces sp. AS58]